MIKAPWIEASYLLSASPYLDVGTLVEWINKQTKTHEIDMIKVNRSQSGLTPNIDNRLLERSEPILTQTVVPTYIPHQNINQLWHSPDLHLKLRLWFNSKWETIIAYIHKESCRSHNFALLYQETISNKRLLWNPKQKTIQMMIIVNVKQRKWLQL